MFTVNQEYDRNDLLDFVGSRQGRSGIIYGNKQPNCVIITSGGKHGKKAGYGNLRNDDGTWNYVGQGSRGDQNPDNFANSLLTSKERNILLFSTREPTYGEAKLLGNNRKKYKFEGIFDAISWDFDVVEEGTRAGDKVVKFRLIPVKNIYSELIEEQSLDYVEEVDPNGKYDKFKVPNGNKTKGISVQEYIIRSIQVKNYALERANGICELCKKPAPFLTSKGIPFLEVHHILKLADDGPDDVENVAAICPNCHREAHFGARNKIIKEILINLIAQLEINNLRLDFN